MTAQPMRPPNGPGWTWSPSGARDYMLWAPREDRPRWSASWSRRNGYAGGHRRGDTLDEVLASFPDDAEGRRARRLLRAAADTATT